MPARANRKKIASSTEQHTAATTDELQPRELFRNWNVNSTEMSVDELFDEVQRKKGQRMWQSTEPKVLPKRFHRNRKAAVIPSHFTSRFVPNYWGCRLDSREHLIPPKTKTRAKKNCLFSFHRNPSSRSDGEHHSRAIHNRSEIVRNENVVLFHLT